MRQLFGKLKRGAGLALGVAIGAAIGAATGNIGLWLALGVAIGAALEMRRTRLTDIEDKNEET